MNTHDLDALVDCFTEDYRSDIPLHPARSFVGSAQVRANWEQIFAGVPDLQAECIRSTSDDGVAWAEWEWRGTRRDGSPHLMRGVTVLGAAGERAGWARFYMEPVDTSTAGVGAAIARQLGTAPR